MRIDLSVGRSVMLTAAVLAVLVCSLDPWLVAAEPADVAKPIRLPRVNRTLDPSPELDRLPEVGSHLLQHESRVAAIEFAAAGMPRAAQFGRRRSPGLLEGTAPTRVPGPLRDPGPPSPLGPPSSLGPPRPPRTLRGPGRFGGSEVLGIPDLLGGSGLSGALPLTRDLPLGSDFSPTPLPTADQAFDGAREQWVYDSRFDVPTQHPWIEWGRIFYGDGITPRGRYWFGEWNLAYPEFYLYGDSRTGISSGRNAAGRIDNMATRLNLDLDLRLTATERFHGFIGPLDRGGEFSRWELIEGDLRYTSIFDPNFVTAFFEGDVGAMMGGLNGHASQFELPIAVGLVPLVFQNGIWLEDAVTGAALTLPARHSRWLNWSNYDATFFAIVDQLNSPAFGIDEHAAQAFGTAWFIDGYGGYIESGYAYVRDRNVSARSYHNMTISFTRRYWDRVSNSLRLIVNTGQDLPESRETADGALLLLESSWITASPLRLVPYANFFVGWGRPQSVARAGGSGGILRNTGINYDTDGLNGYPTLDPTANDTAGGAIGVDLIGESLLRQLLLEVAYLTPHGNQTANVPGDQFATGARYQFPVSHRTLVRLDAMYGWRRGLEDIYGTRVEYRWKF